MLLDKPTDKRDEKITTTEDVSTELFSTWLSHRYVTLKYYITFPFIAHMPLIDNPNSRQDVCPMNLV